MKTKTKTIQEAGRVGEVSASLKESNVRAALKRAGRVFASALLVSGLMLSPMRARAEETRPQEKVGIGVRVGAGYSHLDKEPRALAIVDARVQLPLKLALSGSVGVSSTTKGDAKWEETSLNLDIPIGPSPVFIDLYGYNSRHMFVPTIGAGADIGVALPRVVLIAGYEHLFDFGSDLVFAVVKVDVIPGLLSLKASGGYTWASMLGSPGLGVTITPGKGVPEIGVHTFALVNKGGAVGIDTMATLGWNF